MLCKCGFKFAGPGEFRNCEAFIDSNGQSGVTCPKCNRSYVNGLEIIIRKEVTPQEYSSIMNKIIAKKGKVADTLINLIDEACKYNIKYDKSKLSNKKESKHGQKVSKATKRVLK